MSNENSTDSRRKLLKSIAAGSGAVVAGKSLPESWSKPVIDSVVLPVHAETTTNENDSDTQPTTPSCDEGWVNGDSYSDGGEEYLGFADSRCACEELVKSTYKDEDNKPNGVTWGFGYEEGNRHCYAEFGWKTPVDASEWYETKPLD